MNETVIATREASADDHAWVVAAARDALGSERQVHSRRQFDVTEANVLIATLDREPSGFLTWEVDGEWCEVLAIGALDRRQGVGSALMRAAEAAALHAGCTAMRLVTTDENEGAQRFYERLGYRLTERRVGAVDECRRLYKPEIPAHIHDELEYERTLVS